MRGLESPLSMDHALDAEHAVSVRGTSFSIFYSSEWQGVFRPLAVILRDAELAREATDEAMTRAYQRWSHVSRLDNPSGWVYRVALNWSRSQLRRRSIAERLLPRQQHAYEDPLVEPGLATAVGRLPLRQREVVVLRFVLDWSESEIATALGVPRGTVKSRLHRALKQLRQELT